MFLGYGPNAYIWKTDAMSITGRLALFILLCVVSTSAGCRREEETAKSEPVPAQAARPQPADVLVFPNEMRVEDDSVNVFLERAMAVCTTGDYQAFRLLWSAREEPLPQDEFEEGWQAVREIRIRLLEKVLLAPEAGSEAGIDRTVYAVYADVRLDPEHTAGRREPEREVVLMLVHEHDDWRLAEAPKSVRTWVKEKASASSAPDAGGPGQEQPDVEESG
jgi:hypothetical protein